MRLDSIVFIFIVHFTLTLLILSTSPTTSSSELIVPDGGFLDFILRLFRDYFFIPARAIIGATGIKMEGYMKYVTYTFNSILWALIINYLLALLNNFLNPKRVS
ncbi:MAG: hypothetical protein GWO07_16250 [Candidatus Dadabacteria bacterium]|nr:hypothetical protein [Candidatus Dadabacteria bacterium]NIS10255.1 hypothetical protein [Candidatus Dadabacteria bacterium]NIV43005.1 hypothetical protein [Candidatus Dadabacteria bacterium]NIX16630.1 hypothetical protein [Candidatus Dadabacteria bacterium]NIY23171.1 hypothetical protein [Candidatus Dadabacteria bacterium]